MASIFERSVDLSSLSSPMFIKRFMNCKWASSLFDKTYWILTCNNDDIIIELNKAYGNDRGNIKYSHDQMYWIGYIYLALGFLFELAPLEVYKLFPGTKIVEYYPIYHTFDIEEAAERMMDNIGYKKESRSEKAFRIMKELYKGDKASLKNF